MIQIDWMGCGLIQTSMGVIKYLLTIIYSFMSGKNSSMSRIPVPCFTPSWRLGQQGTRHRLERKITSSISSALEWHQEMSEKSQRSPPYGCFDQEGVFRVLMEVRDYELDQFGEQLMFGLRQGQACLMIT